MATRNDRTPAAVRREIAAERDRLAEAAEALRAELDLVPKLPLLAGGALGAGFVLFGGVGALMRLAARRGREGDVRARVGPFAVVDRR